MVDDEMRPNPDALLAQANETKRGKLKIFFGASAGVGKTYAMLQEAQRLRGQGLDVIIGVVETHGRHETAALIDGLESLPLKRFRHQSRELQEFDLDAALARHPAVILIDELAHSNAPDSRHPKRWQDVEELLDSGIDVFTTVNVQHLESLNDIVGGITNIRVRETVPDHVFDDANEVMLVDLPPDDLRQRLHEGKVYLPVQAERAIENFFRKGNLIALRELALRYTADRVDHQMRTFRNTSKDRIWYVRDAILLCVGHSPSNEKLVRIAARLAAKLGCVWHAVYVETPRLHRLPENQRRAILQMLKLAQELGAETATLTESNEEQAVLNYAREHNLGKVVIGRHQEQRWILSNNFATRLGRLGPELDLIIIALDNTLFPRAVKAQETQTASEKWHMQWQGFASAITLAALITLLAHWIHPHFDQANIVMVYLLGVVLIALFYGRWPSVLSAVLSVASFDLFFVPPIGSLAVSDVQYLITFGVMLMVGISIGNLTSGMHYQAKIARSREHRVRHMYEMSTMLSQALSRQDIAKTSHYFLINSFHAKTAILLPDHTGQLQPINTEDSLPTIQIDFAIALWCYDNNSPAGAGTDTLPGTLYQLQPLGTTKQVFGVLAIEPNNLRQLMVPEQQRLLQTYCTLIANALERLHLATLAEEAKLDAEREQLRNSLLAALSHDLRTPLTILFGQVEILTLDLAAENSPHAQQASRIRQHVLSTTRMVNNLLDMARIQSEGFQLRKEWQSLEEIVGSALRTLEPILHDHPITLELPSDLPLVHCDGSLLERVLLNLLENANKYAGQGATIGIRAYRDPLKLTLEVWDNGPGIKPEQLLSIFDQFSRGNQESSIPGVGLGLTICRAIIEVHGGRIWASNRPAGGADFHITLPLDTPPEIALSPAESESDARQQVE